MIAAISLTVRPKLICKNLQISSYILIKKIVNLIVYILIY